MSNCSIERCNWRSGVDLLGIEDYRRLDDKSVITKQLKKFHPSLKRTLLSTIIPRPQQSNNCPLNETGYFGSCIHHNTLVSMVYLDMAICAEDHQMLTELKSSAIFEELQIKQNTIQLCSYSQLEWLRRPLLEQALFSRSLKDYRYGPTSRERAFWSPLGTDRMRFHSSRARVAYRTLRSNLEVYYNFSRRYFEDLYEQNGMFPTKEPSVAASISALHALFTLSIFGVLIACIALCAEFIWSPKRRRAGH